MFSDARNAHRSARGAHTRSAALAGYRAMLPLTQRCSPDTAHCPHMLKGVYRLPRRKQLAAMTARNNFAKGTGLP